MDEHRLARVQQDLAGWGILEPDRLEITRRFRGAIMRAAMQLQQAEQAGQRPPGHPVKVAVDTAFEAYPLPPGAVATDEHRAFVAAVEVASLPEAVRQFLGV